MRGIKLSLYRGPSSYYTRHNDEVHLLGIRKNRIQCDSALASGRSLCKYTNTTPTYTIKLEFPCKEDGFITVTNTTTSFP